jgi:hypothetical protein
MALCTATNVQSMSQQQLPTQLQPPASKTPSNTALHAHSLLLLLPQVEFERPVDAKGNIEVWLQRLVDGMQDTVKQIIKRAVRNVYEMSLEDFIFGHPAQVCLCVLGSMLREAGGHAVWGSVHVNQGIISPFCSSPDWLQMGVHANMLIM